MLIIFSNISKIVSSSIPSRWKTFLTQTVLSYFWSNFLLLSISDLVEKNVLSLHEEARQGEIVSDHLLNHFLISLIKPSNCKTDEFFSSRNSISSDKRKELKHKKFVSVLICGMIKDCQFLQSFNCYFQEEILRVYFYCIAYFRFQHCFSKMTALNVHNLFP
jgi:hypothetical protein